MSKSVAQSVSLSFVVPTLSLSPSTVLLQPIPRHGWELLRVLLLRLHWLLDRVSLDLLLDVERCQLVLPAQLLELEVLVLLSQVFLRDISRRLALEARQEAHRAFLDVADHQVLLAFRVDRLSGARQVLVGVSHQGIADERV